MPRTANRKTVRKPTQQEALKALETLRAYGRNRYVEDVQHKVTLGQALGMALGSFIISGVEILEAAGAALEDQNNHSRAEVVRAMRTNAPEFRTIDAQAVAVIRTDLSDTGR